MNTTRLLLSLARGLCGAALVFAAASAQAETSMTTGSGKASASARLMFKIVIPSVLILDTKTGTVFSNDARAIPLIGRDRSLADGAKIVTADASRSPALQPVSARAMDGETLKKGKLVSRGLFQGEVLCVP